jgi:endonuclease YncB( thermonuclease family)
MNNPTYDRVRLSFMSLTSFVAAGLSMFVVGCIDTTPVSLPTDQTAQPLRVSAVHGCERADTCTVSLANVPPPLGDHITIRLAGIVIPDANSPCDRERKLAQDAQRLTEDALSKGKSIQITDVSRDEEFRLVGRLVVDGEDIGSQLLEHRLAVSHNSGLTAAQWCLSVN